MVKVIKRDGRKIEFNEKKIFDAIHTAATNEGYILLDDAIDKIVEKVISVIKDSAINNSIDVETIQDIVVTQIGLAGFAELAIKYQQYREERTRNREGNTKIMKDIMKIGVQTDRDNANVGNNFSSKLLRIASEANKWHILSQLLPKEFGDMHKNGDLYIHDLDSYNLTVNCLHVPTKQLLENGFNTGYGMINPPKHIESAAALTCIMLQSSQNDMFGGQSHPNFDNDLAPYVKLTKLKIEEELKEAGIPANKIKAKAMTILLNKVRQAMQSVVYNLNSMHSRAGSQVPFSSINIGIPDTEEAAILCQALLEEYSKGMGNGEQPIFPNIIFRIKKGINRDPGDKYYYLFQLACHVASTRMNPTFMNMDADFNLEYFNKGIYPSTMGCRTYIMSNVNGAPGTDGRGNIAPVTLNIVRLAIKANKNVNKFFKLLEELIEKAKDQLMHRYDVLKKLKVSDLPFVAGQKLMKGSEKLNDNDSIEPILKQGSWGIGFIGLAETLKLLTGKHHGESEESWKLGIKIVSFLREKTDEYKNKYKLNFSCYATPAEGLSNKFTILDKKTYGDINWINTKGFYTNSFHIPVDFPISFSKKIELEAPFHKLCNAGHISYIEYDSYPTGENIEKIIRFAYEKTNISYIGINFHIRYCLDCAKRLNVAKIKKTSAIIKEALKK